MVDLYFLCIYDSSRNLELFAVSQVQEPLYFVFAISVGVLPHPILLLEIWLQIFHFVLHYQIVESSCEDKFVCIWISSNPFIVMYNNYIE